MPRVPPAVVDQQEGKGSTVNIAETTAPRSDQQNFDDYIDGPKTVTIAEVRKGTAEQPVEVHLVEFPGRPYKPAKSMRRVLVAAWGADSSVYPGRRMTLFGDPTVRFGGEAVGGIRISHLSDLKDGKPLTLSLTTTRGKRAPYKVEPLPDIAPAPVEQSPDEQVVAWFAGRLNVTRDQLEAYLGRPAGQWTEADRADLRARGGKLTRGETTVDTVFGTQA